MGVMCILSTPVASDAMSSIEKIFLQHTQPQIESKKIYFFLFLFGELYVFSYYYLSVWNTSPFTHTIDGFLKMFAASFRMASSSSHVLSLTPPALHPHMHTQQKGGTDDPLPKDYRSHLYSNLTSRSLRPKPQPPKFITNHPSLVL